MTMRASRLNPDSRPVTWAAVLFAVVVAVAAFVWSWNALVEVGPWVGLPPSQSWVVPVVLDGAMIVFTLSALVQRARGNSARTEWLSLVSMASSRSPLVASFGSVR